MTPIAAPRQAFRLKSDVRPGLLMVVVGSCLWAASSPFDMDGLSLMALALVSLVLIPSNTAPHSMPKLLTVALVGGVAVSGVLLGTSKLFVFAGSLALAAGIAGRSPHGLVCLLLAVPLPAAAESAAGLALMQIQTTSAAQMLTLMGLQVEQVASQLLINGTLVTVNQDCSGFNLAAPVMMGVLVGLSQRNCSAKTIVPGLLVGLLAAQLINLVRILVLAQAAVSGNTALFDALHDAGGGLAMGLAWTVPVMVLGGLTLSPGPGVLLRAAIPIAVTGMAALALPTSPDLAQPSRLLPAYHRGWVASPQSVTPAELRILGTEAVDRKSYSQADVPGPRLITVMHFPTRAKALEHSSALCFQALGWQVNRLAPLQLSPSQTLSQLFVSGVHGRQYVLEGLIDAPNGILRLQLVTHIPPNAATLAWTSELIEKTKEGGQTL